MRKLVMVIAYCALASAALVASPAGAKPRGINGKIVFNSDNRVTGQEEVYTVDPDGTDRQFVADAEVGQWSPDGGRLALFTDCCGERLVDLDHGSFTQLPLPEGLYPDLLLFCPVWSPDGARLACEGGFIDPTLQGVYTVRASDGGGLQQVTSNPTGDDCPGDYSPDGNRLVVDHNGPAVVRLDGKGLRQLTPQEMVADFCSGSWSPQGNEIVFSAHVPASERSTIWAVHSDGSGLRKIAVPGCGGFRASPTSIGCSQPRWSPDGKKIMFSRHASMPEERFDVYTVNADGTGLFQVTNTPDIDEFSGDWGTHPITP